MKYLFYCIYTLYNIILTLGNIFYYQLFNYFITNYFKSKLRQMLKYINHISDSRSDIILHVSELYVYLL